MASSKSGYAAHLPVWVLIGATLGIAAGLFFGDDAAVLRPIGTAYVKMMEIVVFPYIICSLLHGLGRLSPDTAWQLFRCSWVVYLMVWGSTFLVIFLLSLAIPPAPPPSFIDAAASREGPGLLELLIPSNPFFDLARNHLPAIVIFSIVFGIAIQGVDNKEGFLTILNLVRSASVTIWHWVVLLAPFGVFALFADATGTMRPAALADVSLYLITVVAGTVVLAFWVLPSVIAALCPASTRDILRDLQGALVIAVVTSLSVAALPFIQQAAEKLADRMDIRDENRGEIIKTTIAVSYPLGQLGNFFIWLFVLFAAFYYRTPVDADAQLALPFFVLLSGFGSPSSSIDAVAFLAEWLALPEEATGLYVGMMTITRYGQVVASVMGFAFITMLVTLNFYGKLRVRVPRLALSLLVSAGVLAAVTTTGRFVQKEVVADARPTYLTYELASSVTDGVSVIIEKASETRRGNEDTADRSASPDKSILDRIQDTGELRVGYNPHVIPFSYVNSNGHLVGFDIATVYRLARDLNVDLRLIPFTWQGLERDLTKGRFDLAASGLYVTDERLRRFTASDPYFQSPIALIVRASDLKRFLSRAAIEAQTDLSIGVFNDPVLLPLAKRLFPNARIKVLPSYQVLPDHPDVDAAIWTLEQAKAFSRPRPDFTAVVPKNLGGQFVFAYLMPEEALQLESFLNYWMRLQRSNGFHEQLRRQWIDGKVKPDETPRWSILRNVLGWKNAD